MSYTAGTVSARIELDTSDFDKEVKSLQGKIDNLKTVMSKNGLMDMGKQVKDLQNQLAKANETIADYKKQLNDLRKGNQGLSNEIKKENEQIKTQTKLMDNQINKTKQEIKVTNELTAAQKKQEVQAKKTASQYHKAGTELNKLNKDISKLNKVKPFKSYSNNWNTTNAQLKTATAALNNFANMETKSSEIIQSTTTKNIQNKKKETQQFKKYTYEEIALLEYLSSTIAAYKKTGNTLAIEQTRYENYKKKFRRHLQYGDMDTIDLGIPSSELYDDATKALQKKLKEMLSTLGVSISDVTDGEFKKIRDKTTGKMVEYLDLSNFKGLDENWVKQVKNQLGEFDAFERRYFAHHARRLHNVSQKSEMADFVKGWSEVDNPYINDFIKNHNLERYLETTTNEAAKLNKEVSKLSKNNGVDDIIIDVKKLSEQEIKSNAETSKLNSNVSKLDASKSVEKTTSAFSRLNQEQRKVGLEAKRNERIYRNMEIEASKYLNGLKRGRVSKGVYGTDSTLWANYIGVPERVKTFDGEKFANHMRKSFENAVPKDVFDGMFRKLQNQYKIAAYSAYDKSIGIPENQWNILKNKYGFSKESKRDSELMDLLMGKNYVYYMDRDIKNASKAMNTFNRALRTTQVDYAKLEAMGRSPQYTTTNFENASKALRSFDRGLRTTQINLRKTSSAAAGLKKNISLNADGTITRMLPRASASSSFFATTPVTYDKSVQKASEALNKLNQDSIKNQEVMSRGIGIYEHFQSKAIGTFNRIRAAQEKIKPTNLYSSYAQWSNIINAEANKVAGSFEGVERKVKELQQTGHSLYSNQVLDGTKMSRVFEPAIKGFEEYRQRVGKIADELKVKWHNMSVELAQANAAQYKYWQQSRGSVSGFGEPLQIKGYNDYLKVINQVNKELDILARKQRKASGEIGNWNKSTISLNTYKSKLTEINKELDRQAQRVQKVKNAQMQLQYFQRTDWLNQYKGNMKEINAQLEKQTTNTRNAGRGLTSFNNGVVQTAHSGRILSNTLYQIRGALLSLKMIFTAMGGMALWGFAADIAEGVKETFKSKNEMEAQLRQNSKVSDGGILYFNKQLDELTNNFKKINKYSIGETVSSIGLEFNLSAKQMADFSDIVAMIQSEYVRAGRKESEAALAVKDILQGEFQRLSRETGVGKEELIAYGWNEDKTDIQSLTDALRKAALDRHWDVFAKKATSLNDVMTIMKSRFSETGADLMQEATPLVVGAFNEMIGAIDGFGKAWNSMGTWNRNILSMLGIGGLIGGIGVAIPMITKGMGLAEISTIGYGRSILTAALNLNKMEVAQYGVRKAIAAVISGQKASELATTRSTKAIMGRILGLNQSTLAEKGYLTALVKSKMELSTIGPVMSDASIASLKWYQKLGFLSGGLKEAELANAGLAKSLTKTIFSMKALKIALLGITGIALGSWLAGVMVQADLVKKRIDEFNDLLETGADRLKKQKDLLNTYSEQMNKYGENTNEYKRAKANHDLVQENIKDLETANRLVKSYDKQNKAREEAIKLDQQRWKKQQLINAGLSDAEATEQATAFSSKINAAQYEITRSYNEQYKFMEASSKHVNEYVAGMKKAGVEEKDRVKYINEYNLLAEEAGNHLKEFYQGNVNALAYYAWDRIKMAWLDISSHPEVAHLMQTLGKTWESWQPTLKSISEALTNVGLKLSEFADWFLQSDLGKQIALYGTLGTVVGFVGLKMAKWVTGSKSVFETLKNLKDKLKDVSKWWKDVGDKAEEANDKMGGDTPTPGETEVGGKQWKKGEFWKTIGDDAKNTGRTMFKYMGYIAAAMAIVAVAIAALMMPMGALAATGYAFEKLEPQVRKGIEGLQVVAPTVIAILTPVMVLMYTLSHFKVSSEQLTRGFKDTAVGIALGLVLVTEALVLLNAPLLGLAILGSVYGGVKDATKQGIEAMKVVNEALMSLVPWIPVFIGGIALAALAFFAPEIGIPALAATALGIGVGLLAVTEAIVGLSLPLEALGQVGNNFPDLSSAKQGAEAMKITAEALGYVEEAMRDMTLVKWELLAGYVADLAGIQIGFNLTQLTATGGFFDQLNTFTKAFNQISIETPMPDKVEALKLAGSGISTIGDAMKSVKTALDNLPDEFKNQKTTMTYDAETDTTTVATTDVTGYFDQFKEPLKQLKTFIYDFNHSEDFNFEAIDTSKVANINSAAGMIEQLDGAVQRVKTVMGNIGDANWNASYAQGGVLAGIDSWLFGIVPGGSGSGNYKSSLGASLQSMEDVISDLFTFQSRVNSLGGGNGEGANVDTQTAFVQSISTMITTLADKLSSAVPTFKQHGNSLGTAIVTGFKGAIRNIPNVPAEIANKIMNTKDTLYNTVNSLGVTSVRKFKEAINPMSEVTGWELYYVNEKFTGEWYDKIGASAYNLGVHASNRYKEGLDMNSPGRMARATADEIGFIGQALQVNNLPQMAMDLGTALSNSFHFDLSNIQLPDVTAWTSKLGGLTSTVTGVKDKVSLDFRTIGVNVGSSLNNMKSATIKNIGNIKTSWRGMQDALIASAEHIRSKTTSKINTLKDNMASFWKKIKNPELLISGAAGGHTGTIKRRFASPSLKGHYAGGGTVSRSQSLFKTRNKGGGQPSDLIGEYLQCLLETGKPCYAGGWNFDWRNKIQKRFEGWNTHFNAYHLDDFLNVGKFSNSNFPVKGRADIAKQYIFDVISATTYGKYFNSHFGDDPVAALRAGVFNCWDGTNIVLAIARAFGFEGSRGHGTWNGIGHVWANIPGLGIIDPTAIQNRHSFTSSAVRGYSAGTINRHNTNSNVDYGSSKTVNNTTEVHIHGNVYGVDDLDKKIEQGVNKANRKLFTNSMSGV